MRFKRFPAYFALLLGWAICTASSTMQNNSSDRGLSVAQFRNFVDSLPQLPGTIQAIQFCRNNGFRIDRAAILTLGETSGWQIFVFHLQEHGKFKLEWKSGKLPDSFAVSSADQFQTYTLFDEQTLKFAGCAAHNCPDVFSVMLYVPSKGTGFTANYVEGKVSYSPPINGPQYQRYKMSLDRFVAERRSITN